MTPDEIARWRQVEQVFDQVLDAAPADRAGLLERLSAGDLVLRREVEELLAADGAARDFLEQPAFAMLGITGETTADTRAEETGRRIGPYRLLRQLGRGGMGTVYLAERVDGQFKQQVALKLIRQDTGSPELVQRFLSERQILARLNHAHIARLLDGGTTAEGQPWFALEYVEGESITAYADHRALSLEQRFDLFAQVADAVRHAHGQGVIHRDLKPSNILVTAEGEVKLLDFGIAKDTTSTTDAPTRSSGVVLTPEYCAPEQVLGQPATIATDVYALGTVLYELLTGRRAHRLDQHAPGAVYQAVCEAEMIPPSLAVLDAGEASRDANHLSRRLRGDLDAILSRALQKSANARYHSVDELVQDIERYRGGLPVRARQGTTGYRLRKFVRRHRLQLGAAALMVVAGSAFLIASAIGVRSQPAQQRTAIAQRLFEEGQAAVRLMDLTGAQRLYQGALAEDSTFAIAAYFAGQLAFSLGDPSEGYRLTALAQRHSASLPRFERLRLQHAWAVMGNTSARRSAAESLLLSYPDHPISLLMYASEMGWTGYLDSAIHYYKRAIAVAAARPDSEPRECLLCDGFGGLARAYMDSDSLPAAERAALQWIGTGRDMSTALELLALIQSRQDRHEDAMATYRQLVEQSPHRSQIYWVLTTLMIRAGRTGDLIRMLGDQESIHGVPDILWYKIIALRAAGRMREALAVARRDRGLPGDNDTTNPAWIQAAMIEAQVLQESGRFAASAALFDTAARASIPGSWIGRGVEGRHRSWTFAQEATSLAMLGDTAGLARVLGEVVRFAPQSAWIRDQKLERYVRGLWLRAHGDRVAALKEFQAANHPGYGPPDLAAADLLIRLQRAPEAVSLLQRTLRLSEVQASSTYHTITMLHRALARAFEAAGGRDSARFHYLWVAKAWREGDPYFHAEARKSALRASLLFSR